MNRAGVDGTAQNHSLLLILVCNKPKSGCPYSHTFCPHILDMTHFGGLDSRSRLSFSLWTSHSTVKMVSPV